jgi:transcription initiation factor TFIID TATA-box-binding protein
MTKTKPKIAIVNVVATATINQRLDLVDITKKFPGVEYHPEHFPGAVFRLKNPKTGILLFSTGQVQRISRNCSI